MSPTPSEQQRWTVRPMQCMGLGCQRKIPMLRRALGYWFCSEEHYRESRAAGAIDAVHHLEQDWSRDPRNNPLDPLRCLECGKRVGLESRLHGWWYCTEACYEAAESLPRYADHDEGRRILVGTAAMALAGAAIWTFKDNIPREATPDRADFRGWIPDRVSGYFHVDHHLRFEGSPLLDWRTASDQWRRTTDGLWQPLKTMASKLVTRFDSGSVEFTARGGVGLMFRAAQDLSVFHSVAFRPVRDRAGRLLDYQLHRANWSDQVATAEWPRVPLGLGGARAREEGSFRVIKQGNYFEAGMQAAHGGWNIAARWRERTLQEGAMGLFVGDGHDYGIVSGRISS